MNLVYQFCCSAMLILKVKEGNLRTCLMFVMANSVEPYISLKFGAFNFRGQGCPVCCCRFLWWSSGVKKKKEDVHYRILHGFARLKNAFSKQ